MLLSERGVNLSKQMLPKCTFPARILTWQPLDAQSRHSHDPHSNFGRNHVDLLERIDGVNYERGSAVAGSRGFFLKGCAVRLNLALIQYSINFLVERDYVPLQTPYFMQKDIMGKVAQLESFDEELYQVSALGSLSGRGGSSSLHLPVDSASAE